MNSNKGVNAWVFWPPFLGLLAMVIVSLVNYDAFSGGMTDVFNWVTDVFGWAFSLTTLALVIVVAVLMFTPVGKIRFGGNGAKPEFSTYEWFAISLCASIGIGVVFWGAAEPIYHLASPPASSGIEPFSQASAVFAISTAYLHWGLSQYVIYAICAIPIALAYFNYKQPLAVSSSLYFIMGDKCRGWIGKAIDALCLFAIAGGVAGSLGAGLLQIGRGLEFSFGIEPTKFVWAIIAVAIITTYTISSYSGLQKGIRFLSNQNTRLFFLVMIFVFLVGPMKLILNLGVQSFGDYVANFVPKMLYINPINGDDWPRWWSMFYWEAAMAYAPVIGLFMARIAKGRTIREFIAVNVVATSIFNYVWFAVFGGAAIQMQLSGKFDLWNSIQTKGLESTIFSFFQQFPLGFLLIPVFLLVIFVSFVTLADSMTSCMAAMSTKGGLYATEAEAPGYLKIIWGVIIGFMAYAMIGFAGINGVKMAQTVSGAPIMFLILAMTWSLLKQLYWPNFELRGLIHRLHHNVVEDSETAVK